MSFKLLFACSFAPSIVCSLALSLALIFLFYYFPLILLSSLPLWFFLFCFLPLPIFLYSRLFHLFCSHVTLWYSLLCSIICFGCLVPCIPDLVHPTSSFPSYFVVSLPRQNFQLAPCARWHLCLLHFSNHLGKLAIVQYVRIIRCRL